MWCTRLLLFFALSVVVVYLLVSLFATFGSLLWLCVVGSLGAKLCLCWFVRRRLLSCCSFVSPHSRLLLFWSLLVVVMLFFFLFCLLLHAHNRWLCLVARSRSMHVSCYCLVLPLTHESPAPASAVLVLRDLELHLHLQLARLVEDQCIRGANEGDG